MTEDQLQTALEMLKVDLGISTDAYNERLGQYLESSVTQIAAEGAALDMSKVEDMQLAVMYAAWMWRRRDTMEGMPRMLRWQLNNRIFSQHMAQEG